MPGEKVSFCIPAVKVGLGYNHLWLPRLTRVVGPANAKQILYTARRYGEDEALRMGLIDQRCSAEEFSTLLQDIGALAPLTLQPAKVAIDATSAAGPYQTEGAVEAVRRCFESQYYVEGCNAFTEKRTPVLLCK